MPHSVELLPVRRQKSFCWTPSIACSYEVRQAQAVGISYMSLPTQNPADCSYAALRTIVGSERPENITFQGKRQKKSAMGRSVPKRWAQVDFTAVIGIYSKSQTVLARYQWTDNKVIRTRVIRVRG